MAIAVDLGRKAAKQTNKEDQDRHNVGPDLDTNHLTLIMFLKEFFEKKRKKKQTTTKA